MSDQTLGRLLDLAMLIILTAACTFVTMTATG